MEAAEACAAAGDARHSTVLQNLHEFLRQPAVAAALDGGGRSDVPGRGDSDATTEKTAVISNRGSSESPDDADVVGLLSFPGAAELVASVTALVGQLSCDDSVDPSVSSSAEEAVGGGGGGGGFDDREDDDELADEEERLNADAAMN